MTDISFAHPYFLLSLLALIPLVWWYIVKNSSITASLTISSTDAFANVPRTWRYYLRHLPFALRTVVIGLLIVVLARPQSSFSTQDVVSEGVDIVLAMDLSSSMLARDFSPNRLEKAKEQAIEFVAGRQNDRIGLVVFSGESFTQAPLTTDRAMISNLINSLKTGVLPDGTAIGMGLASAVNRLKESPSKSKIVILLTDGVNNRGNIPPKMAAEIAVTYGVRIYTIGIGTKGQALSPVGTYPDGSYAFDYVQVEIDEATLQDIADMTGGQYFRADSQDRLRQIYEEIDRMEKSKIEVKEYGNKEEHFLIFALWALGLFGLELLLRYTVLRTLT